MSNTLLLLPGLMCDAAVWAPQVQALSGQARCEVVRYGLLDSLSAMAKHVLATAPTERFSLAGHSMGGRVALEVSRLAPERVERLALLDTGTHPLAPGEVGERERAGRMALLSQARRQGMRNMASLWARGMVHPDHRSTLVFESVLDMLERSSPEQFEAQINALLTRPDAAPLLPTITCPTLILCGREDTWSPPEQHAVMHAALPTGAAPCELVIIEQCGHMCTMEQAPAVNEALARWLAH
jgi:pimeloyl-ACP methyl ester carboxylesterase